MSENGNFTFQHHLEGKSKMITIKLIKMSEPFICHGRYRVICKGDGSEMVACNHEDADSKIRGPSLIIRWGD